VTHFFSDCKAGQSLVIQRYITDPMLISGRKFDIRVFVLVTVVNGKVRGYMCQEGYIRTSSRQFTLEKLDNRFIHLTNDAVQKQSQDYSKFESRNKLTF
jgi:tubulin---tyrosine ligase